MTKDEFGMIDVWTYKDIEAILVQLNRQNYPFKKYMFSSLGQGMSLLGTGASAVVYEAKERGKTEKKSDYAIKIMGFGNKHVDSSSFHSIVEAQAKLWTFENRIVRIYECIELRIWIEGEHDVVKVEKISADEDSIPPGNYLHLQFVLMDKLTPVLKKHRFQHQLYPPELEKYDEKEIIKLAFDIGDSVERLHKNNLIHRDIKLENIFYDNRGKHYVLGDFGIARVTDDGLASTVAFTKGYGAPEVVGTLDDKYDYTADIYSFGMVLYVLLNELRFPGSNNYRPTVYQYSSGYVPEEPIGGSDGLVRIVLKMLSFHPDDRYQSMEEVLNELSKLKFGHLIKYRKEHKNGSLVLAGLFSLVGSVFYAMSFTSRLLISLPIYDYMFLCLCLFKSVLHFFKRDTILVDIMFWGMGIYISIKRCFKWWMQPAWIILILLCFILISILGSYYLCSSMIGCYIICNATYQIINGYKFSVSMFVEYRWIAMLLFSLSMFLLLFYDTIVNGYRNTNEKNYEKHLDIYFFLLYVSLIVYGYIIKYAIAVQWQIPHFILIMTGGRKTMEWVYSWNPILVGICGTCFWGFWFLREHFLAYIEKKHENNKLKYSNWKQKCKL